MKNTQLEEKLIAELEGISAGELAGLDETMEHAAGSLSADRKALDRIRLKTLRKAGIAMKEPLIKRKAKRRFKLSTIAAALAAVMLLAGISAAAGIMMTNEYTLTEYFGEGAAAELAQKGIAVNKATANKHFTFRIDAAYAYEKYARLIFTLEGRDKKGRDYIRSLKEGDIIIEMIPLDKDETEGKIITTGFGESDSYDYEKGAVTIDMQIHNPFAEGSRYKFIAEPQGSNSFIPLTKDNIPFLDIIADIDFELICNISPIDFYAEGQPGISLCDYEIFVNRISEPSFVLIPNYKTDLNRGLISEEEYELHKNDPVITFVYRNGSTKSLDSEQITKTDGYVFKGTSIDSQMTEKIIIERTKTEYIGK